jgi:lipoprotein-anchoring transpeptidase ErfK/SrfK
MTEISKRMERASTTEAAAAGLSRRAFVAGVPLLLAGCVTGNPERVRLSSVDGDIDGVDYAMMYAAIDDEPFPVPAVDWRKIDRAFLRQEVEYRGTERPGTIVVVPEERHLYLVREGGMAMRYGVGVGREGFGWSGRATIKRKAPWPTWTPPAEMVARDERAAKYAGGMPGGIENPLGARAMYLYQGDRDTLYRLHGTNEPWSIGQAVSSGCVRMLNQDVIDLYRRVPVGTPVFVV